MIEKYELQPDEVELYTTSKAPKKNLYVAAILLSFIPPFIWGILFFLLARWLTKKKVMKFIVTNERVIVTSVAGINNSYMLGDIKRIAVKGFGIFGAQDVVLWLKGKTLPRTLYDVKDSKVFVKKVRELIKESEE